MNNWKRASTAQKGMMIQLGRIAVDLPDELEKKLRLKTIERFGGRKGDLSKAVEEAITEWVAKEQVPGSSSGNLPPGRRELAPKQYQEKMRGKKENEVFGSSPIEGSDEP